MQWVLCTCVTASLLVLHTKHPIEWQCVVELPYIANPKFADYRPIVNIPLAGVAPFTHTAKKTSGCMVRHQLALLNAVLSLGTARYLLDI